MLLYKQLQVNKVAFLGIAFNAIYAINITMDATHKTPLDVGAAVKRLRLRAGLTLDVLASAMNPPE